MSYFRLFLLSAALLGLGAGCAESVAPTAPTGNGDCRACQDPDSPACAACIGESTSIADRTAKLNPAAVDQVPIVQDTLRFAIAGDTRPAVIDDTSAYPTAVITKIFQDLQAESPRPGFAVATGDYQFSSTSGTQAGLQLDLYIQARANFANTVYPAMGNHECTGATVSNCGPGTTNGLTGIYNQYVAKILNPLGLHNPYYSLLVQPANKAWTAKIVFVAANAWTPDQATWLDSVLAQPTTYTFVVRHESSKANTAPGVDPSGAIIAKYPYTMLIVGHAHTYKHLSQKEIIVGNGGAPLSSGSSYGYGIVEQQADGTVQITMHDYATRAVVDTFAVNADGSPAGNNPPPPPQASFTLAANPTAVTSTGGASASSTISLAPVNGFSGTATLAVSGAPAGAQAVLGATSLGPGGTTSLTLQPGSAAAGAYTVTVTGTSGSETETASVSWTIVAASACAHDLCTAGAKLASSCDPCVGQICAQDSYCCRTSWDKQCIGEVKSICGQDTCSTAGTCAHSECTTGAKLESGCDPCVTQICGWDSYCCATAWDSVCVFEVGSICGQACN
ncbi:MAG TPA: metallophosphoesterase [Haliangiales bacterium]|nr:metallophosphoesterase [Haliangiales bacterium]